MTSISSLSFQPSYASPLDRLKTELAAEISAGTISSGDQSALSSALDTIDSELKQGASSSASSSTSSTRPSRDDLQKKVGDLIDAQVSAGTLTSNQATELKTVFSNTFSTNGPGGPGGPGGPPPGPPPSGDQSSTGSASTDSASSGTDITKLLADFVKQLQESLSKSTSSSYSASGTTSGDSTTIGLLFKISA